MDFLFLFAHVVTVLQPTLRARPRSRFIGTQDMGHDLGYMMDLYTPMTSANTTPATTPGSTPPSGADAYHSANGCGKSPALVRRVGLLYAVVTLWMALRLRQRRFCVFLCFFLLLE